MRQQHRGPPALSLPEKEALPGSAGLIPVGVAARRRHPDAFGPRPNILMAAAVPVHTVRFANPIRERTRHTSLNEEEESAAVPIHSVRGFDPG